MERDAPASDTAWEPGPGPDSVCELVNSASGSSCSSGRLSPEGSDRDRVLRFAAATAESQTSPSRSVLSRRRRTASGSKSEDHIMLSTSGEMLYTKGRPPWYDEQGLKQPLIIGICGGSASGKTTVALEIINSLKIQWVTHLSLDSFYKVLTEEHHQLAAKSEYNFDHPDAFDFELLKETLKRLREGKHVEVPVYNFTTHSREKHRKTMYGADVIIFEGILSLHDKEVRDLMDVKVFVDTDADVRLARRLRRDTQERGRDIVGIIKQYEKHVKPAYDQFIGTTMQYADIYVPEGGKNRVAIEMIVERARRELDNRGYNGTLRSPPVHVRNGDTLPGTLKLMDQSPQVVGIHTFLRNKRTSRDEFIFYADRLMRQLIEAALALLPFAEVSIRTPQGSEYLGKRSTCVGNVCGVSILRAGETMETALRAVIKDCKMGKILIQTNPASREPELHFLRLPKDIRKYRILLLDAAVATGAAAIMAIRVLLDHDVAEENIILVSLLMAETGVHSVAYAFPNVRLLTTAVDPQLNHHNHILPGIGNFGDRYYGTQLETFSDSDHSD